MKKCFTSLLPIIGMVILISCAAKADENAATSEQQTEERVTSQTLSESEEPETSDYTEDWDAFRNAIRTKDEAALKLRCTEKVTDYSGLLFMCNEIFILQKLDETDFEMLEPGTEEEDFNFKFYAEDIGIDEFGYEYASAVTLFFITTEEGLFLNGYSAAG